MGAIFTDGITEAENLNQAQYNVEQLIEAIKHNLPPVAIESDLL